MLNPPPLLKSLDYHHILDIYHVPSWEDSDIVEVIWLLIGHNSLS